MSDFISDISEEDTQSKLQMAAAVGRQLLTQNQELQGQLEHTRAHAATLEAKIKEFEALAEEMIRGREKLERYEGAHTMLENQLRDAERITTRLQEEIKQKDQHIRAMAAASEAQSVENSPQYKDMQKRVEEYQNFLGSAKQHIESFQNANTKLSSQIESLEADKQKMNARIQELEKENQGVNEMKQNIQFLKQKNEELNFKLRNQPLPQNSQLAQLENPIRSAYGEDANVGDEATLLRKAAVEIAEMEKALGPAQANSPGALGQLILDLVRNAANPHKRAGTQNYGDTALPKGTSESTALVVVGLITLQKMRETLMQYRKKNDETNELVEDFQNVKAALQREQQAKPKLQQALDGAKNEIEQLKIKIGRLEKDLEGRPQQNQSQSQEDLKKLEDEIDDLTAKLLAVEAEKRQFEKAREDEVRALQKKCDQLDNQVFKTEMLLAEKNAFLAEQAAIIDQFNFFN